MRYVKQSLDGRGRSWHRATVLLRHPWRAGRKVLHPVAYRWPDMQHELLSALATLAGSMFSRYPKLGLEEGWRLVCQSSL